MKLLPFLLAATVALANGAAMEKSVYQFGKLIMCLGGVSFFDGWDYNGYGCYCGYGGQGTPVDDTDRCCQKHDNCYERAKQDDIGCSFLDNYIGVYDFEQTYDADGNCAIKCKKAEDYSWYSTNPTCREFMCECDRVGAQCFADKYGTFDKTYVDYDKASC